MNFSRRDVARFGALGTAALMVPGMLRAADPTPDPLANPLEGMIFGPGPDGYCDDLRIGLGIPLWSKARNEWLMYYFGGDRTPAANAAGVVSLGFATLPGLAKSKDGLSWQKVRGPGPGGSLFGAGNDVFASWASVVHDGGLFHMHYTAGGGDYDVLHSRYATSKDGLNWEKKGEVRFTDAPLEWDSRGIIAGQIMRNPFPGPRFLMIYAGIDGNAARLKRRAIAAAVSDDCVNWTHLYDKPIFTVDASKGWDAGEVTAPHLVVLKDELRLYYLGGAAAAEKTKYKRGVGLAIAPGHDLRGLRRFTGTV